MDYYSDVKNYIIKFAGKWTELEKIYPELVHPDPERKTRYVLTCKGILAIK